MAISPSPSTTSTMAPSPNPSSTSMMAQSPKPLSVIRGFMSSIFSPRPVHYTDESQFSQPEEASSPSIASLDIPNASSSTFLPPSQHSESLSAKKLRQEAPSTISRLPIVIARDFAYEPKPEILPYEIDENWVVRINIAINPVPGLRERMTKKWEADNIHLYRMEGNRADPPNTIPKTWGGRSKAEDQALMHQAERDAYLMRTMRGSAKLGLTPTEPDLGGVSRAAASGVTHEGTTVPWADAYRKRLEAEAIAAGYGPLIKTPPNSPPPEEQTERRAQHFASARRATSKRSRDTLDSLDSERVDEMSRPESSRKRARRQDADGENEVEPSTSKPYTLRQRQQPDETANSDPKPSPKRKGKGESKAKR